MKKRILALTLCLCLIFGTGSAARAADDQWPPADSENWTNLTLEQATSMIDGFQSGTWEENAILIYYRESCGYSTTYVPKFLEFAAENGLRLYGIEDNSQGTFNAFWRFPSISGTIYFPGVVVYNAETKTALAAHSVFSLRDFVSLLKEAGVYTGDKTGTEPKERENIVYTYDTGISPEEWEVLRLTNQHRMSIGLAPLTTSAETQMAGNQRALELVTLYDSQHLRPDGSQCFTVLEDYNISYHIAAENIAMGQRSAQEVVTGWLNSPGHRRNIEDGSLTHMGVGCDGESRLTWAQDFVGHNCSYRDLTLSADRIPQREGTLEERLTGANITVTATCSIHGACVLPLIAAMCSGYDPQVEWDQTVTVTLGGAQTELTVEGTGPAPLFTEAEMKAAADALYDLGLFAGTGVDANGAPIYELDREPSRYEGIIMLVRLLGKEEEARNGIWETPFTDMEDAPWAQPYVGYAYANGLTSGTGDGTTFGGTQTISASQYLAFVLRSLGYQIGVDFQWDRAWELADQIGLTHGEYNAETTRFIRGDVALISLWSLSVEPKQEIVPFEP